MKTTIPMDLDNWRYISMQKRNQELIDAAIDSPGKIFALVDKAEGSISHVDELTSLPPMLIDDLLPKLKLVDSPRAYLKHWILRAQVIDGILRASCIRIDLDGTFENDENEKRVLCADIKPSRGWKAHPSPVQ
jgi:hypothetical protein